MKSISAPVFRQGGLAPQSFRTPDLINISSLVDAHSPRSSGEDAEHVRRLASSDLPFPPIIVHRPTMRVIDGMHRVRAARLRGENTIEVEFFDGSEDDAFLIAVKINAKHGLPLSTADRTAAVLRIFRSHPQLSDRLIAEATGLSARTVGTIRRRVPGAELPSRVRVGKDGRVRPLNAAEGRRTAAAIIAANPGASLREVAEQAGVAVSTVRDVRERLKAGRDPVPRRLLQLEDHGDDAEVVVLAAGSGAPSARDHPVSPAVALQRLRRDPSLRFTDAGRSLLRVMGSHVFDNDMWEQLVDGVPAHCASSVASLARRLSEDWLSFAQRVEARD